MREFHTQTPTEKIGNAPRIGLYAPSTIDAGSGTVLETRNDSF